MFSHLKVSCRDIYEGVMSSHLTGRGVMSSHLKVSCLVIWYVVSCPVIWRCHVQSFDTCQSRPSYMSSHLTPVNQSRHARDWVTSHMWMSHVRYVNEAHYICEWVTSRHTCEVEIGGLLQTHMIYSHKVYSHVTHESRDIYRWVMSHIYRWVMSHVYRWVMSHTYRWVISHTWMSHVILVNESCHMQMMHVTHVIEAWRVGGAQGRKDHWEKEGALREGRKEPWEKEPWEREPWEREPWNKEGALREGALKQGRSLALPSDPPAI